MPRYELSDGDSNKFWEIRLDGNDFVTCYGRIGTSGQETRKKWANPAQAQKEYDKLVAEKVKKGYSLVAGSPPAAPAKTAAPAAPIATAGKKAAKPTPVELTWKTLGPKQKSSGSHVFGWFENRWYTVERPRPRRRDGKGDATSKTKTNAWKEGEGWKDESSDGAPLEPVALVGIDSELLLLASDGTLSVRTGEGWRPKGPAGGRFEKMCGVPRVAFDPDRERLVLWGGNSDKGKALHQTRFMSKDGTWSLARPDSPKPKEFDSSWEHGMIFDTALRRMVRFDPLQVAILEGDVWQAMSPPNYEELSGERWWEHLPLHDPKSGETLFANLDERTVSRFDPEGCVVLARFDDANGTLEHKEMIEGISPPHTCFDVDHLKLHMHGYEGSVVTLELAPIFAAARALGPRGTGAPRATPPAKQLPRKRAVQLDCKAAKKKIAVGKSRLGGHPDLPASIAWPEVRELQPGWASGKLVKYFKSQGDRLPIPFVCQVNLAELENDLADKGMLYFFASLLSDDLYGIQAVIFYDGDEPLLRREQPLDTKAMGVDAPYPLPEYQLTADPDDEGHTHLFGEPTDSYDDDDDENESDEETGVEPDDTVLLLQICGGEFGTAFRYVCDDGSIFFTLTAAELARKDFSNVLASLRYP